ncbi:MAG: WbqC family protein [Prevotella sp.]|nr:WbqC family protein [Prevotella sp.]
MVILASTYFGPVQWYQKLCRHGDVLIERYDHFMKQTYRNRCIIAAANGLQALTVPVEKGDTSPSLMKDIRISDHGNWRHLHWQALQSAYGESPFFEFYADDIRPFFEKKWTFLFDFNLDITAKMCELLDIEPHISLTNDYTSSPTAQQSSPIADLRNAIHPKHPLPDSDFTPRRYYQVYEQRYGFQPNLSILDLLFNMGNESVLYLQ